jgi:hypothetical protein
MNHRHAKRSLVAIAIVFALGALLPAGAARLQACRATPPALPSAAAPSAEHAAQPSDPHVPSAAPARG